MGRNSYLGGGTVIHTGSVGKGEAVSSRLAGPTAQASGHVWRKHRGNALARIVEAELRGTLHMLDWPPSFPKWFLQAIAESGGPREWARRQPKYARMKKAAKERLERPTPAVANPTPPKLGVRDRVPVASLTPRGRQALIDRGYRLEGEHLVSFHDTQQETGAE